ncbi:Transporter of the ATP-binding cassette (ABC), partial [Coemansia sp. RSA 2530]
MLAFSWSNDILRRGSVRTLEATDMYRLDESDLPIPNWRRYLRHRKAGRSLMVTLMMVFAPELVLQAVLSLANSVLLFSGPFFLQRILRSIEILGDNKGAGGDVLAEKSIRGAYLDAFGLLFFTLAASVLYNMTQWVGHHIEFRLKGLLVAELSSKTLRRRGKGSWEDTKSADDEENDGDGDAPTAQAATDGKIMNLLTADFSKVAEVSAYLDNLYALPLMLFLGIWYMYVLLGVSALVGLSLSVLYIPLSKVLFKHLAKVEEKLTSLSDERVTVITELLQGIKAVKLFGWESRFLEMVDEKRKHQLKYQWRLLLAWVHVNIASSLAPMLVLVVIFVVYIIGFGNRLTAEIAFTTISVFQLIRIVFEHLPGIMNWAVGGYVALGRIDSYLGQPQVQDLEKR